MLLGLLYSDRNHRKGRGRVKRGIKKMGSEATSDMRRYQINEWRTGVDVRFNAVRSVSKRRESMSRFFENRSETRDFVSADFPSRSFSSTEPALFSRATHNSADHGKRRVVVKLVFFRLWTLYFPKSYTNTLIFAA